MIIIYIDIILLVILLCLVVSTCVYCIYRVYTLQRAGQVCPVMLLELMLLPSTDQTRVTSRITASTQVAILLRPTKVLFSHKKEGETADELRTVMAYQNPFTGDYCVHKSRAGPTVYSNRLPESPDSGLSDEYEPLHDPPAVRHTDTHGPAPIQRDNILMKPPLVPKRNDNTLSSTWNWNYTEYQI